MNLNWVQCVSGKWCDFFGLNLDMPSYDHIEGVYLLFHESPEPVVIYVGHGHIKGSILDLRRDPAITQYRDKKILVTWAKVPDWAREGVVRFLTEAYLPLEGSFSTKDTAIIVNLPW